MINSADESQQKMKIWTRTNEITIDKEKIHRPQLRKRGKIWGECYVFMYVSKRTIIIAVENLFIYLPVFRNSLFKQFSVDSLIYKGQEKPTQYE